MITDRIVRGFVCSWLSGSSANCSYRVADAAVFAYCTHVDCNDELIERKEGVRSRRDESDLVISFLIGRFLDACF